MKKVLLVIGLVINVTAVVHGQEEQNIWIFGDRGGLNFNTTSPTPDSSGIDDIGEGGGCASLCDASGQLLFYSNGLYVWNRFGTLMPSLTSGIPGYTGPLDTIPPLMPYTGDAATQAAVISGVPAHPGKYYLFSLNTNGQVFYSMIDMSLDSGRGDIVAGKKEIFLSSGNSEKMTVVKGCDNIWLIVRSLPTNQYKAYEINDTRIITTPVISYCGLLPLSWYRGGVIKFSPDGQKMAAACYTNNVYGVNTVKSGGLEMYDFDMKTGILSNAVVLDSSSTTGYYFGACFSPDNTKLYASTSSFGYPGKVRQFDLSLGSTAAIIASNTSIYTDIDSTDDDLIGDLKRGVNGKIYLGNNRESYTNWIPYMHCINFPNVAGIGCGFTPYAIPMSPPDIWIYRALPNDIALMDAPDTVRITKNVSACFKDSIILSADTGKCYQWHDGSINRSLAVRANGIYTIGFVNSGCDYEIDSFKVNFVHVPVISSSGYSCDGQKQGVAWVRPVTEDTATFIFTWKDANGTILQQHSVHTVDTIRGLDTGLYNVQVHTIGGCDTALQIRIQSIPSPQAAISIDSIMCKGIVATFSGNTDAPVWKWYFGDGDSSKLLNPTHGYSQTSDYTVTFIVSNAEGCSDTINKELQIKDFKIILSLDKEVVNVGEQITLQSSGSEPYMISAWLPTMLFTNQTAYSQTITMDTNQQFMVIGQSADGCIDSATVEVSVNPSVFIPTAFSPNGDGLNDWFRPRNGGSPIFIQNFEIFNRWGQMVWSGTGAIGAKGWDGTFHGIPADIGVYFYTISIETQAGKTIALKGDVTLIR